MNRPLDIEVTQEEIVERIDSGSRKRLQMSAEEMVSAFREGRLEEPFSVIDLLSLAGMLDTDHPLYVEP